jgi:hypothetical protein
MQLFHTVLFTKRIYFVLRGVTETKPESSTNTDDCSSFVTFHSCRNSALDFSKTLVAILNMLHIFVTGNILKTGFLISEPRFYAAVWFEGNRIFCRVLESLFQEF